MPIAASAEHEAHGPVRATWTRHQPGRPRHRGGLRDLDHVATTDAATADRQARRDGLTAADQARHDLCRARSTGRSAWSTAEPVDSVPTGWRAGCSRVALDGAVAGRRCRPGQTTSEWSTYKPGGEAAVLVDQDHVERGRARRRSPARMFGAKTSTPTPVGETSRSRDLISAWTGSTSASVETS